MKSICEDRIHKKVCKWTNSMDKILENYEKWSSNICNDANLGSNPFSFDNPVKCPQFRQEQSQIRKGL